METVRFGQLVAGRSSSRRPGSSGGRGSVVTSLSRVSDPGSLTDASADLLGNRGENEMGDLLYDMVWPYTAGLSLKDEAGAPAFYNEEMRDSIVKYPTPIDWCEAADGRCLIWLRMRPEARPSNREQAGSAAASTEAHGSADFLWIGLRCDGCGKMTIIQAVFNFAC
jgi:hypothetical protein